jgi:hypothetical protein
MEIFGCLLSLRARADFHLGFIQEGHADHIHFSPYVVCEKKVGPAPSSSSGASPALASADRGGSLNQCSRIPLYTVFCCLLIGHKKKQGFPRSQGANLLGAPVVKITVYLIKGRLNSLPTKGQDARILFVEGLDQKVGK